jgi:hypothetical protein
MIEIEFVCDKVLKIVGPALMLLGDKLYLRKFLFQY